MTLLSSTIYFVLGFLLAYLFPRMPGILITRGKGFNVNFPPHPESIPLTPYLTQRVLHMRMFYWLGLVAAIIPLAFGLISLRWGNVPFGFGLWLSSGWFILSRLQSFMGGPKPPWTLDVAERLQIIINDSKSDDSACCNFSSPEWLLTGVYCSVCSKELENMPRPDLGRKRSDGFFMGFIRLLSSDGHPMFESNSKNYDTDLGQAEE